MADGTVEEDKELPHKCEKSMTVDLSESFIRSDSVPGNNLSIDTTAAVATADLPADSLMELKAGQLAASAAAESESALPPATTGSLNEN